MSNPSKDTKKKQRLKNKIARYTRQGAFAKISKIAKRAAALRRMKRNHQIPKKEPKPKKEVKPVKKVHKPIQVTKPKQPTLKQNIQHKTEKKQGFFSKLFKRKVI